MELHHRSPAVAPHEEQDSTHDPMLAQSTGAHSLVESIHRLTQRTRTLWLGLGLVGFVALSAGAQPARPHDAGGGREPLLYFWGVGCPRCDEAKPVLERLSQELEVPVVRIEVRQDAEGRARFLAECERLGIQAAGVPTFILGDRYLVGFRGEASEQALRGLLSGQAERKSIDLPFVGAVDPSSVPFGLFTVLIGLLDGVNPCAMYVLFVLLGILARVRDQRRVLWFGATFVLASGLVYFLFMVAWAEVFALVGLARWATYGLGVALVIMGLINLKETVWFKVGPSLMIPERAKPGLFKRMRNIANASSFASAVVGIAALALVVNLVELACTLGLPAVYTRLLTARAGLGAGARFAYLALYNVAYVVPLAAIVAVYAVAMRKLVLGEREARWLKGLSGGLLLAFGLLLLLAPEVVG